MPVLFCSVELYLPHCHSLKEKRRVIQSAQEKLRKRFKCSVSELDHQDLWQRSTLSLAVVSTADSASEPNNSVSTAVRVPSRRAPTFTRI